ncbi:hypothetical protein BCR35DRAFT_309005 [Leucosporidium creatinivorum]|uniref:FAD/NAD(P)-binding domain-containing protein n=1 Tax=Leucosporidium creatinivorum TaxID=106004 RepID=A0A1Y2DRM5_9BASI|nr:hypothetical protein BCR35DRAFT_309005 [Leucosporidium creatinivorum]
MGSAPSTTADKRVAIIGGGASGLVALEEALEKGLDAQLYEAREEVGGAWLLSENPGPCLTTFDSDGLAMLKAPDEDSDGPPPPTPMYPSLKTNVPSTLMEYRSRPFPPTVPLFPGPAAIAAYVKDGARSLEHHISLSTRVTRLRWTTKEDGGEQRKWFIETKSTSTPDDPPTVAQFDFVIVANGHYSKPWIPLIEGLPTWSGEILHSRWYRSAEAFKDKTVLVLGNGASGYDATRECAVSIHERRLADPSAELPKIYQSARSPSALGIPFDDPSAPDWAREITVFPPIAKTEGKRITFVDGRTLEDVDVILFATGYLFSFPFVDTSDAPFNKYPLTKQPPLPTGEQPNTPSEGGLRVRHLDSRDTFYHPDPTLALICLPYLVIPFSLAQIQSRLATAFWAGRIQLTIEPGVGEEVEEARAPLVWGHPKQFDSHDRWLEELGEGEEGFGKWSKTSAAMRDLRQGAKGLRRAVLGY